jgi:hypothetical protein
VIGETVVVDHSRLGRHVRSVAIAAVALQIVSGCGSTKATPSPARARPTPIPKMIASVPFVAAPTKVREECDETAGRVGYAVPCPTLLPAGLSATPAVAGCGFAVVAAAGQAGCGGAEWHDWIVGSSQVGNETTAGFQHLVVVAAPRIIRDPARAIDGPAMAPGSRVQGLGVVRIGRETMHWYFVPPNLNIGSAFMDHLVLVWNASGHTYAYGFHVIDTLAEARALDLALVRHLTMVPPPQPRRQGPVAVLPAPS